MTSRSPEGPPRVQIQTQAGCNGRCIFCPNREVIGSGLPHGRMSEELFYKIVDELAQTPPRRIGLYLMNEPLGDARLPAWVRHVTERIPSAKTQVISNGTYLSEDCAEALIGAGLKQLKVSLQSLDPATNQRLMGHSSEEVIRNCIATQRLIDRKGANIEFRVSMIVTKLNEPEIVRARAFWKQHGIRLVTSALENRGGNIKEAADLNPHAMASMGDCIRPSRDMMILFNGDAPLCCVDWFRTVIVGNVAEQSVQEVWNGPRLQEVREALRTGDPLRLPDICRNCAQSAAPHRHRRGLRGLLSRVFGGKREAPAAERDPE